MLAAAAAQPAPACTRRPGPAGVCAQERPHHRRMRLHRVPRCAAAVQAVPRLQGEHAPTALRPPPPRAIHGPRLPCAPTPLTHRPRRVPIARSAQIIVMDKMDYCASVRNIEEALQANSNVKVRPGTAPGAAGRMRRVAAEPASCMRRLLGMRQLRVATRRAERRAGRSECSGGLRAAGVELARGQQAAACGQQACGQQACGQQACGQQACQHAGMSAHAMAAAARACNQPAPLLHGSITGCGRSLCAPYRTHAVCQGRHPVHGPADVCAVH